MMSVTHLPGCDLQHTKRQRCSTVWSSPSEEAVVSSHPRPRPILRLRIEGWAGTAAIWQIAGACWSLVWFILFALAYALWASDLWFNDWLAIVPLVAFAFGYMLVVVPGFLFALFLVIPALRGDRLSLLGIAALLSSVLILMTFEEIYFPSGS